MSVGRSTTLYVAILATISSPVPAAVDRAAIVGRVVDGEGAVVAGCRVAGEGVAQVTTDAEGLFQVEIGDPPAEISVSCEGYLPTKVTPVAAAELRVVVQPVPRFEGRVDVHDLLREPTSSPDARAEREALVATGVQTAGQGAAKLPGVYVERDNGEEDRIVVRGGESRLVSTMLDGERLPSPTGVDRTAPIGMLPVEAVSAMEVRKIFSPDAEGDLIAGGVDLLTTIPPPRRHLEASVQGSVDDLREQPGGGGSVSLGRGFVDDKLHLMLSASALRRRQSLERFEQRFGDGSLERSEVRAYDTERDRTAFFGRLDAAPGDGHRIVLKALSSNLVVDDVRSRVELDYPEGQAERELQESERKRGLRLASVAGQWLLGSSNSFDYRLQHQGASEDEPRRFDTSFVQDELGPEPELAFDSPGVEDAALFLLDQIGVEDNGSRESNTSGAFDVVGSVGGILAGWKAGAKVRIKNKDQDTSTVLLKPLDDVPLEDYLDGGLPARDIFGGTYSITPMISPAAAGRARSELDLIPIRSLEEDAADYDAQEQSSAGYGLVDLDLGRAELRTGVRYEQTRSEYAGFEARTNGDGTGSVVERLAGSRDYGVWLPMASVAADLGAGVKIQGAVSRTFARPDYFDLVPSENVDLEDREISRGNPDLRATRAWNLDFGAEWIYGSAGRVSLDLFHKTLDDFIFVRRRQIDVEAVEFDLTQPQNGDSARLYGAELAWAHTFAETATGSLAIEVDVLHTRSRASLPDRPGADFRLPDQADWSGSVGLRYRRGPVSASVFASHVSRYLYELGESPRDDLYLDAFSKVDVGVGIALPGRWHLDLAVQNLTDAGDSIFQEHRGQVFRTDRFGRTSSLRLAFDF